MASPLPVTPPGVDTSKPPVPQWYTDLVNSGGLRGVKDGQRMFENMSEARLAELSAAGVQLVDPASIKQNTLYGSGGEMEGQPLPDDQQTSYTGYSPLFGEVKMQKAPDGSMQMKLGNVASADSTRSKTSIVVNPQSGVVDAYKSIDPGSGFWKSEAGKFVLIAGSIAGGMYLGQAAGAANTGYGIVGGAAEPVATIGTAAGGTAAGAGGAATVAGGTTAAGAGTGLLSKVGAGASAVGRWAADNPELAIGAGAAVGRLLDDDAGKPTVPYDLERSNAILDEQKRLYDEARGFTNEGYQRLSAEADIVSARANEQYARQNQLAGFNQNAAMTDRARYERDYVPAEAAMVAEAMGLPRSAAAQAARDKLYEDRRAIANADVNQAYANMAAEQARTMGRYGVNPNSGRAGMMAYQGAFAKARDLSQGNAQAIRDVDNEQWNKMGTVVDQGRGLNTSALGFSNAAGANSATAATTAQVPMAARESAMNFRTGGLNTQSGMLSTNMSNVNAAHNTRVGTPNNPDPYGEVLGTVVGSYLGRSRASK